MRGNLLIIGPGIRTPLPLFSEIALQRIIRFVTNLNSAGRRCRSLLNRLGMVYLMQHAYANKAVQILNGWASTG
jgi:hypothetical protein